jgi:hypothetical protein
LAQYLDGIQAIDDNIKEFNTVASGTTTVGTNQYPVTAVINKPVKLFRNYLFVFNNKSGQTISSIHLEGRTTVANVPIPNTPLGTNIYLKANVVVSNGGNNNLGCCDLTSEEPNPFAIGNAIILFNLAAAPTSGTIDWALIGY